MSKSTLDKSLLDIIGDPDGRCATVLILARNDTNHAYVCYFVMGWKYLRCLFLKVCQTTVFLFVTAGTPEDKMRLFLIFYITALQPTSEVRPGPPSIPTLNLTPLIPYPNGLSLNSILIKNILDSHHTFSPHQMHAKLDSITGQGRTHRMQVPLLGNSMLIHCSHISIIPNGPKTTQ